MPSWGAGLPDIGSHFSDTDPRYKDISSLQILSEVREKVQAKGNKLINIDAEALGLKKGEIGIKSKTAEGLGVVGEGSHPPGLDYSI